MSWKRAWEMIFGVLLAATGVGCGSDGAEQGGGACSASSSCGPGGGGTGGASQACPEGSVCDSGTPTGPVRGKRSDGTVDATPADAWPDRQPEPPPLSFAENTEACAWVATCLTDTPSDVERGQLLAFCIDGLDYFWEERAVPTPGRQERWAFEAREVLAAKGDCAAVNATRHAEQPLLCEEAGCWWSSDHLPLPVVSCTGDIATLRSLGETFERDCSRAFQHCDPASPTGCTDRRPVACEHPAKDRCDGDVRIGCDGTGRISFHDCARRPGGHCETSADGTVACKVDGPGCVAPWQCDGDLVHLCSGGVEVTRPWRDLGLDSCDAEAWTPASH
jgi:hypothetical protein